MPNRSSLEKLRRCRHYVFVLVFVLSALVGPPDTAYMAIVALSIYLLFEIGLFFRRLL